MIIIKFVPIYENFCDGKYYKYDNSCSNNNNYLKGGCNNKNNNSANTIKYLTSSLFIRMLKLYLKGNFFLYKKKFRYTGAFLFLY